MGYEEAATNIQSAFADYWGAKTPVHWPNQKEGDGVDEFARPEDSEWIRFTLNQGDSNQQTLEENPRYRHLGTVIIQVFVPIGYGEGAVLELIDDVAAFFRGETIADFTFRAPQITTPGRDGKWYQKNITIPFLRDEVPA